MNLDFFKEIENSLKNTEVKETINNFLNELSGYLQNYKEKPDNRESMENSVKEIANEQNNKLDEYRVENCIYQVVDFSSNGVYLQNTSNNIIFEETNITQELKDRIGNDSILKYKNGEYVYDEELTEDFFNKLVNINEYKKIQDKFIKESNIEEIDSNTRYKILSKEEEHTILEYNKGNTIEVPNALIPYFAEDTSILYYEDGKFKRDL